MTRTTRRMAVLATLSLLLSGCNTIEGMGKDISKAGDKIEEAAKKTGSGNRKPPPQQ